MEAGFYSWNPFSSST